MAEAGVLRVTDAAREMVLAIRGNEDSPESLALFLEINGTASGAYTYDMWFQQVSDVAPGDAVTEDDGLSVVVVSSSVDRMQGATLDVGENGGETGLVMLNPNTPAGSRPAPESDLSDPISQRILKIIEDEVNPQIAMHGGFADLVAFEEGTAYVRMLGGCQGCGLASVTLSQGISVAIQEAVPEVTSVVDVTDHASGTNPYYESAKK